MITIKLSFKMIKYLTNSWSFIIKLTLIEFKDRYNIVSFYINFLIFNNKGSEFNI